MSKEGLLYIGSVVIVFVWMVLLVASMDKDCHETNIPKRYYPMEEQVEQCISAGGIPIRNTWNGGLENCIFPPKK